MPQALQIPPFEPQIKRPPFIPYDVPQMWNEDSFYARKTATASDAFRAKRTPGWDQALKAGQSAILDDVKGDSTLMPMVQSEAIRAGLGSSLAAFGDQSNTSALEPDSAATARVSTNLFGTANAMNQQIRDNRYRALQVGDQLFPETQVGLSGTDAATIFGANTLGKNEWNDADYHDKEENERLNWRVQVENLRTQAQQQNTDAAASAQSKAAGQQALVQGGAAVAGVAVLAIAL